LAIEAASTFAFVGQVFVRKVEHHLTVFGSTRGKLLRAATANDPDLFARVAELTRSFDFRIALDARWVHLIEIEAENSLETIVVLASARVGAFFAEARSLVSPTSDAGRELIESLASPPPPHVTVFTSDQAGRRGIGIASQAELDAALAADEDADLVARGIATDDAPSARLLYI
jgi:hypothetical protein